MYASMRHDHRGTLRLATGVALTVLALGQSASASDADPVAVFREGERMVAENHAENVTATKEGMLRGAIRIEEAIALGYAEKFKAYRLLGYAYSQVSYGISSEPVGRGFYRGKARRAYEEAAKLRPGNAEVLMDLAGIQPDEPATVEVLRAVLRVDPGHADAQYLLGRWLVEGLHGSVLYTREQRAAQILEGAALLKRAAPRQVGPGASDRRANIASLLEVAGRKADAEEIRRRYGLKAE